MGHGRTLTIGAIGAGLLLGGCAAQSAGAAANDPAARTITGTATGKVAGTPDTLTVTLGVQTREPTARAALAQNTDQSTRVIAALKAAGVAPKDLQTASLSLDPSVDRQGRITGYSVSNAVTAKIHDLAKAGAVVDAAAAQAGDSIRVSGVVLSIEDTSTLVAAARADAVTQARAQARQLARAAHVQLGTVEKITERRPSSPGSSTKFSADSASVSGVPIEAGTQDLSVDVTVVFAID